MGGFEEFFSRYYDEVVRTLALASGDRGRAEDAAQEAFARAYRRWSTVAQMERPVGWVVVTGVREMRRWITRHDRRFGTVTAVSDHVMVFADPADAVITGAVIREVIELLPPRQRATVVLRYLCDLSTDEVAQALGCSSGTVKSALHAGLANLRVELQEPTTREAIRDA